MRILIAALLFSTSAWALQTPDFETGEWCWKYGAKGKVTRPVSTDITYLGWDAVAEVCGEEAWGCYKPIEHKIYLYRFAGKRTLYEEQCHSLGLHEHNNCYPHYGIGKDESACDWNLTAGSGTVHP